MYKLMIVDDEPLVIKAISYIIKNNLDDIKIIAKVNNGSEAIELARDKKPDIIFMDIRLDGLNGLQAIKEINRFLPTTKVVIISAYDNFSYAQKAIKLGVMEYILKPVDKHDIINILEKVKDELKNESEEFLNDYEIKHRDTDDKPEHNPLLVKARNYINENYNKDLNLNDIAQYVALSPSYLSKLFKENFDLTIIDYLTDIRINKAVELLNNTKLSIKNISSEVGYNDSNYFSKVFKKYIGQTPTEFRKNQ